MNFQGHIKTLASVKNTNTFESLQLLLKQYDWDHDYCLAYNKGKDIAFNDSYAIQLNLSPVMNAIRGKIKPFKMDYTDSTLEIIKLGNVITCEMAQLFPDHYHLKSHFVAIIPHGKQIRHIDALFYHEHSRRLVLPIITSNLAFMNFDNTKYCLETGIIYELNGQIPHWSENNNDSIRVFLLIDLIPPDKLQLIKNHYNFTE